MNAHITRIVELHDNKGRISLDIEVEDVLNWKKLWTQDEWIDINGILEQKVHKKVTK